MFGAINMNEITEWEKTSFPVGNVALHGTRSATLRLVDSRTIRFSKRTKNGLHGIKRPTWSTRLTAE
jgi:hypothetical protein